MKMKGRGVKASSAVTSADKEPVDPKPELQENESSSGDGKGKAKDKAKKRGSGGVGEGSPVAKRTRGRPKAEVATKEETKKASRPEEKAVEATSTDNSNNGKAGIKKGRGKK